MRAVAKFQFVGSAGINGGSARLIEIIKNWGSAKFTRDGNGLTIIRKSGLPALFDHRTETAGDLTQTAFDAIEPVAGGQLSMQVRILSKEQQMHFQCSLALGSESGLLSPTINLRSPRFIKEIVEVPADWRVARDAERVFAQCFLVSANESQDLERLIRAPERRLPIVAISELHGETLATDIHSLLSSDLCGLAHTCRLTHDASWQLTASLGKEWSCFNGAIRLYWPFRANRDDPRAHPLWTRDRLLWKSNDEKRARDQFRETLSERLFEASTFVADDPGFARFEAAKIHLANVRSRASADGDFKAIADSYAAENDALRARVEAQIVDIETLKQNIESLTIALRSEKAAASHEVAPESPPETVAEAVQIARNKLKASVVFSSEIDEQVKSLNETAGPPDKVLRYLLTLGELATGLTEGGLGRSIPIWLRDHGVDCSGESETIKKNKAATRQRSFMIDGKSTHCEYHAKPSDGVHPDLCVRIYFTVAKASPKVRIGYIGRHFD